MTRQPPGSTRTHTLFPYPPLFRSLDGADRSDFTPHRVWPLSEPSESSCAAYPSSTRCVPMKAIDPKALFRLSVLGPLVSRERQARGELQQIVRSEEHTSELQSLMRISYAVFCLETKIHTFTI